MVVFIMKLYIRLLLIYVYVNARVIEIIKETWNLFYVKSVLYFQYLNLQLEMTENISLERFFTRIL